MNIRTTGLPVVVLVCLFVLALSAHAHAQRTEALLLFGGQDHKTFLGCLNCSEVDASSVCNVVGKFGSIVSENSIWNIVGNFGSVVSSESPWNVVASDPPVIVDKDGNSYGYFTENVAHDQTRIPSLVNVLDYYDRKDDLDKARDRLCGDDDDDGEDQ